MWIPAGTLLQRKRIPGHDDLFSNYYQTREPTIALFLEFENHENCKIMLDGQNWSVKTRGIRHNVEEKEDAN